MRIKGLEMFVLRKIWRALFSWNTCFEIRPFALLPTNWWLMQCLREVCQKSTTIMVDRGHPHYFFYCLASLAKLGDHAIFDVLFYLMILRMDLHISSLGIAVPEGPCCVFYATKHQVYWGLTWYKTLCTHLTVDSCKGNRR